MHKQLLGCGKNYCQSIFMQSTQQYTCSSELKQGKSSAISPPKCSCTLSVFAPLSASRNKSTWAAPVHFWLAEHSEPTTPAPGLILRGTCLSNKYITASSKSTRQRHIDTNGWRAMLSSPTRPTIVCSLKLAYRTISECMVNS